MKILVPMIDTPEELIRLLIGRKYAQGVELRIIMVIPHLQSRKTEETLNNSLQGIIDAAVTALKKALPDAQVSGKVLMGDSVSSITQEAEEWKPDLIIMGARKRNWFLKFFFGSGSEEVAKRVNCKVEIIQHGVK